MQLDGGGFASPRPQSYRGLAAGRHRFQVRATDPAGNMDPTPASRSWIVDMSPPDTTIASGPADPTTARRVLHLHLERSGSSFACRLDGAAFASCTPSRYSGLAVGPHLSRCRRPTRPATPIRRPQAIPGSSMTCRRTPRSRPRHPRRPTRPRRASASARARRDPRSNAVSTAPPIRPVRLREPTQACPRARTRSESGRSIPQATSIRLRLRTPGPSTLRRLTRLSTRHPPTRRTRRPQASRSRRASLAPPSNASSTAAAIRPAPPRRATAA